MGIGASIFLIALGTILAYGVNNQQLGWLDLSVVGWVLILAGLSGLLVTFWAWRSRRRTVRRITVGDERDQPPEDKVTYTEEYRTEAYPPDQRPK